MAIGLPFTPTTGATVGKTQSATSGAGSSSAGITIDCTATPANNILVTASSANTTMAFVRVTGEAAGSVVAAATDLPLAPGASRVIMNPVTNGKSGAAVFGTAAATVLFTPGEGGT